jgi:hypothetical protein
MVRKSPFEKLGSFITSNELQLSVQLVGIVAFVVNVWLATKLAPLALDLVSLTNRVANAENAIQKAELREERVIEKIESIETNVTTLVERVEAVKGSVSRIEDKLDKLYELR